MKIKTSELSGMALCYTVCMIEMPHLGWGKTIGKHHASDQIVVPELPEDKCYGPFASWRMFGPIIEQERIAISTVGDGAVWEATQFWACAGIPIKQYGPTPLVAAMRCLVASRLGDEVEIPEELCK